MSVFGVCMVRDELDILPWTLPRMAAQLDHVLIADNRSTDGTSYALEQMAKALGNVTVLDDPEPAYMQSLKMSRLAHQAGEKGALWVVPFDADEIWTVPGARLAEYLHVFEDIHTVRAVLYDHVATGDDPEVPDVMQRIGWRRKQAVPLPKVACRVLPGLVIEQGNHGAHYPGPAKVEDSWIEIHHYPYRSVEQMARKARNGAEAYAAAGNRLPSSAGRHWREYGRFLEDRGIDAIREIFETWFYVKHPEESDELTYDPCTAAMC